MLSITSALSIPERELRMRASRGSGPGGQHVNKVETRVTLCFDVAGSPSLTAAQKRRIGDALGARINNEGVLRVSARRACSQSMNRAAALDTFRRLLRDALAPRAIRKTLRTPRSSIEQRLDQKRRRGRIKQLRIRPRRQDE